MVETVKKSAEASKLEVVRVVTDYDGTDMTIIKDVDKDIYLSRLQEEKAGNVQGILKIQQRNTEIDKIIADVASLYIK